MKARAYKRKNKYSGIRMAKFEKEKALLEEFSSRQKKELEKLNQDISEENSLISELEKRKKEALLSGNQEEFKKASEQLRSCNDSLEFYTRRRDSLKEVARVKEEEVLKVSESIRNEQNRLNKDSLKWLYEELRGIVSVLVEVNKELIEGDEVLFEIIQLYEKTTSEREAEETLQKISGYNSYLKKISYPERSISNLLDTLEGHLKFLEQEPMKKWIE